MRWRASLPPTTTAATSRQAPKASAAPLNDRDRWLAAQVGPALAAKGMIFVGLDVIGGFVTEINVTSPTGIRELDKQFNLNIGDLLMQAIRALAPNHAASMNATNLKAAPASN